MEVDVKMEERGTGCAPIDRNERNEIRIGMTLVY